MQERFNSIKTHHVYFWCLHDFDISGCVRVITSPVINGFHNMIVVFFSLALIDSSLVSTDSSPVSTDSSLQAFLLLEPSLLQSKSILVNKICIVLYFEIILLHFIWNKYFLIIKTFMNFQNKYLPEKKYSWHQSKASPSYFNATGCRRPWNLWESHCLHRQPNIWNSCTSGVSSHHSAPEGTPAWTKLNLHHVGDLIKRHTDLFKYRYMPYV